jgi:6-phosphogluconolactonase
MPTPAHSRRLPARLSGTSPEQVAVDATGMFADVPSAADNDVGAFTINGTNGALTTILGSPFTAGTQPSGVLTVS